METEVLTSSSSPFAAAVVFAEVKLKHNCNSCNALTHTEVAVLPNAADAVANDSTLGHTRF